MPDATPREVADAVHYAADEAARIVRGTPGTEDDRAVRIVAKALLTADAVAAITFAYNALDGSTITMDAAKIWEDLQDFLDAHPDIATPLKEAEKKLLKLALDFALEKLSEATGK